MKNVRILSHIMAFAALVVTQAVLAQQPASPPAQPSRLYDKTFLTNYDQLQPRAGVAGQPGDLVYIAPGALERLSAYKAVMVDQPELLFSPESEVKGMKPDDVKALCEALRSTLSVGLAEGGYSVAQQPGPGVIYLRVALTDVIVKKKKRGLLAYTPVGAVVKAGGDALKDAVNKVDFIETTFQAELIDSVSNDVLGSIVAQRGQRKAEGQKETRIDVEQMSQNMRAWTLRLRCQLDNSKLPEDKQTVCVDDASNAARYPAAKN